MVLITSLQDRLALEIGAQVITRHRIEAELDQVRDQFAELQATTASGPAAEALPSTSTVDGAEIASMSTSGIEQRGEVSSAAESTADQMPEQRRPVATLVCAPVNTPKSFTAPPLVSLRVPVPDMSAPSLGLSSFAARTAAVGLQANPIGLTDVFSGQGEPAQRAR